MELAGIEDDHCPYCADCFEIVCLKFRFARNPTMVVVCPSCAYIANWGRTRVSRTTNKINAPIQSTATHIKAIDRITSMRRACQLASGR